MNIESRDEVLEHLKRIVRKADNQVTGQPLSILQSMLDLIRGGEARIAIPLSGHDFSSEPATMLLRLHQPG